MPDLFASFAAGLMLRHLRRAFRRVAWVGPLPELPPGAPLIWYSNHHSFFDGYLAYLVATHTLGRPTLTWMAEWDRFPFFGALGAQPFPPDDPKRRAATMRRTLRHFRTDPSSVLVYFPEGAMHPPEDGLAPFDETALTRLGRLFPDAWWWPVAIHLTWRSDALPVALLRGAPPHEALRGDEHERLASLWHDLRTNVPTSTTTLLTGRPSPQAQWDFSFAARFFERRL